ncbi:MAG: putative transrane protein [Segetibacter sp.]|jgi:uncharacterized Tic20 family protein|nr:putative transrane protein [Segetibacter sp.]
MQQNSFLGADVQPDYVPTSDERTLATLSHILTLVAPILAPLIIYLIKKDESKYVAYHAKESLNFQITMIIVIIGLFLTIVGILLVWIVGIVALVLVIIATIKANEGKLYRYPLSLRLIR